jgi:hypothetical protein
MEPKMVETKTSIVLGLVGTISLVGGIAIFATAGHTDEPPLKYAFKAIQIFALHAIILNSSRLDRSILN